MCVFVCVCVCVGGECVSVCFKMVGQSHLGILGDCQSLVTFQPFKLCAKELDMFMYNFLCRKRN